MLRNKSVILDINILFLDFNCMVYIALFLMKKQEFYNHKKPRKLMDQVRDVMRLNRNRERIPRILSKRIWGYREFQLELVNNTRTGFKNTI